MGIWRAISERYKRWRHGRGFGVHSPFAYTFITEVLRQPYAYYAYGHLNRRERLVFRVVLHFRPATVAIVGPGSYKKAVADAMPAARFTPVAEADILIVTDPTASALAPFKGRCIIAFDANASAPWQALNASLTHGMTFDNGIDTSIAALLPHLPRQTFLTKF